MKKKFISIPLIIIAIYLILCGLLFVFQEKLLFFPDQLSQNYQYSITQPFEEINHSIGDGEVLNSVLVKSSQSRGVVYFLHGNAGALDRWIRGADLFTRNGYDVLYLDYRGFGKSGGKISSEEQLINDTQKVYDELKKRYNEEDIILVGTSIGTGMATQLAAKNHPQKLILNSPYASLKQLIQEKYPIIPEVIIKYELETKNYISQVKCPIYIFHGEADTLIPTRHAVELKEVNERVHLQIMEGYGHNDLTDSKAYQEAIDKILR